MKSISSANLDLANPAAIFIGSGRDRGLSYLYNGETLATRSGSVFASVVIDDDFNRASTTILATAQAQSSAFGRSDAASALPISGRARQPS